MRLSCRVLYLITPDELIHLSNASTISPNSKPPTLSQESISMPSLMTAPSAQTIRSFYATYQFLNNYEWIEMRCDAFDCNMKCARCG